MYYFWIYKLKYQSMNYLHTNKNLCLKDYWRLTGILYSKTPLLRPPLGLRKKGLYSEVVLLLS